jgi:hypothetical protein
VAAFAGRRRSDLDRDCGRPAGYGRGPQRGARGVSVGWGQTIESTASVALSKSSTPLERPT